MTRDISKTETPRTPSAEGRYPDMWSSFRREMDSLFDNFFGNEPLRSWTAPGLARAVPSNGDVVMPDMDVKETNKEISVIAELPGLDEGDVDLTVTNGILTISGEKKYEKTEEKGDYHVMERRFGSFRRSLRLPESADIDKVAAVFDKGVLSVTIPKKKESVKAEKHIKIARK